MKKTIQLLALTLILLVGGMATNVATGEVIYRTQICYEGEDFYVDFGNLFENNEVFLCLDKGGKKFYYNVGYGSTFIIPCISQGENQGDYWFGLYMLDEHAEPYFEYKLCVTLLVRMPVAQLMNDSKKDICSGSLVCIQEKSLVWKSKMLVLA